MSSDIRIGSKLKLLREFRNIKQETMAEKLNISASAYSRLEQNQSRLTVEIATKIAEILDISLADLISKENPIISFTYMDSVKVENGYVNNKFEMSKEAFESVMKAKNDEIAALKEQIKGQQEQINNFTKMLDGYMKGLGK